VSVLARPAGGARQRVRAHGRGRTDALPAWAITAAFGLAYVIVAPPSSDLAAAGYRSDLFARAGLTLWDNGWYGGHHLPGYSLLAPALGALLGVQLLAALSMTAATALFERLVAGRAPRRAARLASLWLAVGASVTLLANRVAFDLGLALALGSLLIAAGPSADRLISRPRRHAGSALALALVLAALSALASPVAGAFLALAALAWAVALRDARRPALGLALAALVPIVLLAIAFPEGGSQPFVPSAFYPALAAVLALAVAMGPGERVLRAGALLYALALLGAYVIATPVGGNVDRLGALLAGPLLALTLSGRASAPAHGRWRARALIVLAALLLYWQVKSPIGDYVSAATNPAAKASYYSPLLAHLRRLDVGYGARPARIEVVPTRNHAEARWVADRVAIARGWERQLETERDGLFYEGPARPSAARYHAWLNAQAISYVALPDAVLDYSGRGEARVVRAMPSYLREVWRSAHWRLFAVLAAAALAQPPSELTRLDSDSFTLRTPAPGTFLVRVRFTPYWALANGHGCVRRAAGGWTDVQTRAAGSVRVAIDFSLSRVFAHGPRCR
jgi:hypothetical protein